ncbi:MAG TPA: helix-turn-helix transcriptional regulator [Pyrinomonadaceae bacterium]|jgi:transcriptional regulator with XRE-family HTH domain|nr:helix-turn-helix transcriptional regulator [Pyrinomonadaceae bacterium]
MGTSKTERPEKLAGKLRRVRLKLGLSQTKMAAALAQYGMTMHRGYISFYENEERLPPILVVLAYARLAKVPMDLLIDDERDLPKGF